MESLRSLLNVRRLLWQFAWLTSSLLALQNADAVYINRFSTIANGAITFTGNSLGLDKATNSNAPGTAGSIGTFTSTDLTLVDGTYPPGTTSDWRKNSSAAQLVIPAGSTVLYAELIWSGSYGYGTENVSAFLNNSVGLKTPAGSSAISPNATTAQTLGTVSGTTCTAAPCYYVRSADITSLVQAAGAGTYTISGVPATQSDSENNANTAGWTLAVVYKNSGMPSRNLSLFVGAEKAGDPAATVAGFCTPPTGPRSGRLLVSAMEGDRGISGDQMQFGPTAATVTALAGPNNTVSNFFAGQINNDAGLIDTTGTFGTLNHTQTSSVNGGRQGYDITNVDVSGQLANNQTSAAARGTTTGDQYVINALGLQINIGAPIFPVSTKTANVSTAKVGDVITYTIKIDNTTGTADANNTVFKDPLPAGLSFVAGSFTLDGVVNANNPTTGVNIGTVTAGTSKTVVFQARVDSIPGAPATAQYDNAASWDYEFIPCAGQPLVRGSLTTNPATTRIARLLPAKSATPSGSVSPNDVITYTLNLTNDGTADSSSSTLQDPIPANTTYIAGSTKLNGNVVADALGNMPFVSTTTVNSVGNSTGVIAVAKTASVTFQVKVNATASGVITNTAVGDIDGIGGAPSSTAAVANAVALVADLSIAKVGPATLSPNGNAVYTITISNAGPSAANGATFSDILPSALNSATASCSAATGGAVCPASISIAGNTVSGTIATLPAGSSITLKVAGTVGALATGNVANTATVSPPSGTTDPNNGNNSSTSNGTISPVADLVVTKTGPLNSSSGSAISYQVVIRNDGPSAANNSTFSDLVPASITGLSASCGSALGGAVCPGTIGISGNAVSGAIPTLPPGASVTLTISGTVAPSATGSISNAASASPPGGTTDPNPGNSTSTTTTNLGAVADLSVVKTGPSALDPNSAVNYNIVISNAGPSNANGANFNDIVPSTITGISASCSSATAGAICPTTVGVSGNTVSAIIATLPAGSSITVNVSGTVTGTATGTIINTATIAAAPGTTDPNPNNNSSNTAANVSARADLSIQKTGPATADAGGSMTYNFVIRNNGPSDVFNASFSDNSPADLNAITANCVSASGGAICPTGFSISGSNIAATLPQLPVGSTVVLSITGTVNSSTIGSITNGASIATPASTPDNIPANNTSAVTTAITPIARLSIAKTGPAAVGAGTGITYNLVISNAGPSAANSAIFSDTVPASISGITATCGNASGGATCPANVTVAGNVVSGAIPNLPAGSSVTITIAGTVSGTAVGSITNTANVSPPAGVRDPDLSDNNSTTNTPVSAIADIKIVKFAPTSVNAGGILTYSLQISNTGPSAANSTSFSDILNANLLPTAASCGSASGGAVCPASVALSGNTVSGNVPTLPAGASVVVTITATVNGSATGSISNTATATPAAGVNDPDSSNNTSTVNTSITPVANLSISKVGPATVNAGGAITYNITIANTGPSIADGASFSDLVPSSISGLSASCGAPSGGAICPSTVSINANTVSGIVPTLPPGASVTITVNGTVAGTATGSISNSASVSPPSGVVDQDVTNNTSTTNATVTPVANVSIQKFGPSSFSAGGAISYRLRISNAGPSSASLTTFNDIVPSVISGVSATCGNASAGASCPTAVSVSGNTISGSIPTLASGASLEINITGVVAANATGTISNTATIGLPPGVSDPDPGNNTSTVATPITPTADVSILKTSPSNATPGSSISYTLLISNAGPSSANGTSFLDNVNSQISGLTASCGSATNGAICPSNVAIAGNAVSGTVATLPANSSVTITISGTLAAAATGAINNTAALTLPIGTVDPTPANNSSTVTTTLAPTADLQVTKVKLTPSGNLTPGQAVQYQIELTNNGPSNVVGATLTDLLPPGIASMAWSCAIVGSADCDTTVAASTASGIGSMSLSNISLNAGVGNKIVVTVNGIVANSATGTVSNTTSVTLPAGVSDPNLANNSATTSSQVSLSADVTTTKNGPANINAGARIIYTVTLSNAGPSAANGTTFTDNVPAGISNIEASCLSTTNGAICPAGLSISGNTVNATVPTFPANGTITFEVKGIVSGTAPNTITNTASAALPAGITDPTPSNNSSVTTTVVPVVDLSATKVGPSAVNAGAPISYNITLRNSGPSPAINATFTDNVPSAIGSLIITCANETNGAICPSGISSSNAIALTIPSIPAGASMVFTVAGVVANGTTGTLSNTALITVPSGTIDSDPTNNSSTEVTAITPVANVGIVKAGPSSALAGGAISYTLTISNALGVNAADDTTFSDLVPSSVSGVSASCTSAAGGAVCPASINVSGNSVTGAIPTLPAGGSVVITINGTVRGSASGSFNNVATVATAAGVGDSDPNNNTSAIINTTVGLVADVRVQKTAPAAIQPTQTLSYTIVVSNDGPSVANGTTLVDAVPNTLTNVNVTCGTATGGAVCPAGSLNTGNNINAVINNLPANGSLTFTVNGTVIPSALNDIVNTAQANVPASITDTNPANNSSTATTTVNAAADISITKTGPSSAQAGGPISYTITVTNSGPSAAGGTSFSDLVPASINGITAVCSATTGGAICPTVIGVSGNNVSATIPTLPFSSSPSSVNFTVSGTVSGSATGTFTNTATVAAPANLTDTSPGNSASVTTAVTPVANVSIEKTGPSGVNAGGNISYQIRIRNAGPSSASGTSFSDAVPTTINNLAASCISASNGASCPAPLSVSGNTVAGVISALPNGGEVVLQVTGTVSGSAIGAINNTASLTLPAGIVDPVPGDNTSTATTNISPVADLQIVKTGPAVANAGGQISYNLRVTNLGPSSANGTTVSDLLPATLVATTATCANTSGGAICPTNTSVNGNQIAATITTLPAGGVVNLTVNANVIGSATGIINNTAQVSLPSGVTDPDATNNTSTIGTTVQLVADVRATKTGPLSANPNSIVNYTIVLVNSGPSAANGSVMTDQVPAILGSVSASCISTTGGASCVQPTVAGNNVQATIANFPAGSTLTFNVQGTVGSGALGSITNTVSIAAPSNVLDPDPTNNTALSNSPVTPVADVRIEKSAPASVNAGGSISYALQITNAGPSIANLTNFLDNVPTDITNLSATCASATNGATCPVAINVSGNAVSGVVPTLPAGGSLIITINGSVKGTATGSLSNTASITLDPAIVDPTPGNNQSTVSTSITPVANLSMVKTGGSGANVAGPISYTLTISNAGPSTASGAVITDNVPADITGVAASCAGATGGATCPSSFSILGNAVSAIVPSLPAGGSVQVTINGTVANTASGSITNTASVAPPAGTIDPDVVNNSSAASTPITPTADLKIEKSVQASHNAGDPITYTVKVTNLGPSRAVGAMMTDNVASDISGLSATCGAESLGAVCASSVNIVGNAISSVIPSLPAGSSLVFTIKGNLATTASGILPNTASIAAPTGVLDPQSNNDASLANTSVTPLADLSISKVRTSTGATVVPGAQITYQIIVRNAGPAAAAGIQVTDTLPSQLINGSWQCIASGTADCDTTTTGTGASGNGNVNLNSISVAGNATSFVTINVTATVSADAQGSIVNNAILTPPSTVVDPVTTNNIATDTSAVATTIRGHAFADPSSDGVQSNGEADLSGLTVTLTPIGGGTPIVVITGSTGDYTAPVAPATEYTIVITPPPGQAATTRNNPQVVRSGNANTMARANPVGFAVAASVSGSVWRDINHDRQRNNNEPQVAQFKVEVLDAAGTVVGTATTDSNGNYAVTGLAPSIAANPATHYTVRFRDPANNVLYGRPVSQDTSHPNGQTQNGVIDGLVLLPGINTSNQSLPLDPSGVVYDSSNRQPIAGALVQLSGPTGFNPATHLLGGVASLNQTTSSNGFYQFLLLPGAPAGNYNIAVTAPANYISPSLQIPAQPGAFSPPAGPGVFAVQGQETAPAVSQPTTYYLAFNLKAGSADVVNNHIPLDPIQASSLFVTKVADRVEAELGDSVLYTISIRNASGPSVSAVTLADKLPAGFRYIPGTAQLTAGGITQSIANPSGGVGPNLNFAVGAIGSGASVQLTYRVRLGVGSQQGDGINRAQAVSGNSQSNIAQAKVKVTGGVFTQDACLAGKIFVDCNGNHLQDPEELGIPGVRLYMEDGTWLVSDTEGKYSFCGLKPITHVIKVDRRTLPIGAELASSSNRNALDANSLFIDTQFGELHRADFIEGTCKPEVIKQVKARRAQGRVAAPETEKNTPNTGLTLRSKQKVPMVRGASPAAVNEAGGVR
jgi:uncharacterized repeat protein (TIGR01451 family)